MKPLVLSSLVPSLHLQIDGRRQRSGAALARCRPAAQMCMCTRTCDITLAACCSHTLRAARPQCTRRCQTWKQEAISGQTLHAACRRHLQRRRLRHSIAPRALDMQKRELLVGDVTCLLCFCFYKQVSNHHAAAVCINMHH